MDIVVIMVLAVVGSMIVTFCVVACTIGRKFKNRGGIITGADTSMFRDSTVIYLGDHGGLRDLTEEEKRIVMEYNLRMQQDDADFQEHMKRMELELQDHIRKHSKECTNSDAN